MTIYLGLSPYPIVTQIKHHQLVGHTFPLQLTTIAYWEGGQPVTLPICDWKLSSVHLKGKSDGSLGSLPMWKVGLYNFPSCKSCVGNVKNNELFFFVCFGFGGFCQGKPMWKEWRNILGPFSSPVVDYQEGLPCENTWSDRYFNFFWVSFFGEVGQFPRFQETCNCR